MGNAECGIDLRASITGLDLTWQFRIPHSAFSFSGGFPAMKIYDLSQPLNERSSFWPYYPPFEVKYIKRKAEHGVNAQYIMRSEEHTSELQSRPHLVCRLLLEKNNITQGTHGRS